MMTRKVKYPIRGYTGVLIFAFIFLSIASVVPAVQEAVESGERITGIEPESRAIEIYPGYAHNFDVEIWTDRRTYYVGDSIRIYFRTNRDAYVYIYDIDPTGATRLLFPNWYDRDNFVRGHITYSIPDYRYDLKVTGPTGRETLHIIAVRRKYRFLDRYYRFSPREPFPLVEKGPRSVIQELEKQEQKEATTRERAPARIKAKPRYETIEPVPAPPPHYYGYAEDITTIYVRPTYWEPYDWYEENEYWYYPGYGYLVIRSSPSRARIYVDGSYKGTTPKTIKIRSGWHSIRLTKTGYYDWRERVYVSRGERSYIYADLDKKYPYYPRYEAPRERSEKREESEKKQPPREKKGQDEPIHMYNERQTPPREVPSERTEPIENEW